MSLFTRLDATLRRFCRDRRGAFTVSFVLMAFFLLGLAALGFEGSRYLNVRARLSDGLEQAALALVAQDRGDQDPIASAYINAYLQSAGGRENVRLNAPPHIQKIVARSDDDDQISYLQYKVSAQIWEDSWFSSALFPSFAKQVMVGGSGAARKYRSSMDVVFVVDFSTSMLNDFDNNSRDEPGYDPNTVKSDTLKRVVLELSQKILTDDLANSVGFQPFAWGEQDVSQTHCVFPFVAKGGGPADPYTFNHDYDDDIDGEGWQDTILRLADQIDYQATIDNIPNETLDFSFPFINVYDGAQFCMFAITRGSRQTTSDFANGPVPLTHSLSDVEKVNAMSPWGSTFISGGILEGVQMLAKGKSAKKVLVIVSDGTDFPVSADDSITGGNTDYDITEKLMALGMCDKIRQALTNDHTIAKLAFIGVSYQPTVDWKACVGEQNYYEADNAADFADAMHRAVFEEVGHSSLYDR